MKISTMNTGYALALASSLFLSACGSSSSGPAQATISDANEQQLAVAATEGVKQAVNSQNASDSLPNTSSFLPKGATADSSVVGKLTQTLVSQNLASFDGGPVTIPCTNGGTATVTLTPSTTTVSFNNCVEDGSTINGSVTYTFSQDGTTFTISYNNVTITTGGVTERLELSATCTSDPETFATSCTYNNVSGLGIDGRTYSVSNISVTGNSSVGYTVDATVTDPDNGQITIETTMPVSFNCTNGNPDSGVVVVTAGSTSMTITFNDCNSFSVTRNGSTTTYNWADLST